MRSSTRRVWVCTGIGALANLGRLSSDILAPYSYWSFLNPNSVFIV
jgi:hypothetical protein